MITALLLVVGGAATMALLKLPGSGSADQQVATAEPEAAAPLLPPRPVAEASALPAETSALVEQPLERPADEGVVEPTPETPAENVEDAPPPEMAEAPVSAPDETAAAASPAAAARGESMPASRPLRPAAGDESAFETDVPATDAPRSGAQRSGTFARNRAAGGPHGGANQIPVGRLVNDSEVLLHGNGAAGGWQRLSTRDALMAEDELIALPTFRPGVALSTGGGAVAHLLGGSVVRLTAPDANGIPGIHVIDGQVVVATAGKPGTELNVQIDDQIYLVTFRDADARLAIDVRRWLPDGADPIEEPARSAADIYVPNGEIEYSVGGCRRK